MLPSSASFLALSQLVAAGNAGVVSDPDLLVEAATWSKSQHATVVQAARELSEITEAAGPYFQHPYFGVHATSVQPAELVRMTPSFLAIFLFPALFTAIGQAKATLFVAIFPLIGLLTAIFILPEVYGYEQD